MKVLLTTFDLYASVGGGQSVYRRLIETHPEIDFHYFRRREAVQAVRPANAHALDYEERYR